MQSHYAQVPYRTMRSKRIATVYYYRMLYKLAKESVLVDVTTDLTM